MHAHSYVPPPAMQALVTRHSLRAAAFASSRAPLRRFAAVRNSISVTFVTLDGSKRIVRAPVGDSMLEVAHANGIDIEGACGGEAACSTCHVYVQPEYASKLPATSDEEEDMLDITPGRKDNSRLGCQVRGAPLSACL